MKSNPNAPDALSLPTSSTRQRITINAKTPYSVSFDNPGASQRSKSSIHGTKTDTRRIIVPNWSSLFISRLIIGRLLNACVCRRSAEPQKLKILAAVAPAELGSKSSEINAIATMSP